MFTQQRIWKFFRNRFVEEHIFGNAKAKETGLAEVGVSSAVLPFRRGQLLARGWIQVQVYAVRYQVQGDLL
jgi:hypothetical protein